MSDDVKKFGPLEFIKTKYDGLDGKTKVSFQEINSEFKVIADQTGIIFKGEMKVPLSTMAELTGFADLTSKAWAEYKLLKPNFFQSGSGH